MKSTDRLPSIALLLPAWHIQSSWTDLTPLHRMRVGAGDAGLPDLLLVKNNTAASSMQAN